MHVLDTLIEARATFVEKEGELLHYIAKLNATLDKVRQTKLELDRQIEMEKRKPGSDRAMSYADDNQ